MLWDETVEGVKPIFLGSSYQSSITEPQPLDNHQPSQSWYYIAWYMNCAACWSWVVYHRSLEAIHSVVVICLHVYTGVQWHYNLVFVWYVGLHLVQSGKTWWFGRARPCLTWWPSTYVWLNVHVVVFFWFCFVFVCFFVVFFWWGVDFMKEGAWL